MISHNGRNLHIIVPTRPNAIEMPRAIVWVFLNEHKNTSIPKFAKNVLSCVFRQMENIISRIVQKIVNNI